MIEAVGIQVGHFFIWPTLARPSKRVMSSCRPLSHLQILALPLRGVAKIPLIVDRLVAGASLSNPLGGLETARPSRAYDVHRDLMVPGQVLTQETIDFMRKLDVKEIHGYERGRGLKLLKPDVITAKAAR
jgi:hypothetical protein